MLFIVGFFDILDLSFEFEWEIPNKPGFYLLLFFSIAFWIVFLIMGIVEIKKLITIRWFYQHKLFIEEVCILFLFIKIILFLFKKFFSWNFWRFKLFFF